MRISDWSSDVCSSDLGGGDHDHRLVKAASAHFDQGLLAGEPRHVEVEQHHVHRPAGAQARDRLVAVLGVYDGETVAFERSEERREGTEWGRTCRFRGERYN